MTIQEIRDRGLVLFECMVGSQAYGTNTPESDYDYVGVFMTPDETILDLDYDEKSQTIIEKLEIPGEIKREWTFYDIRKFMKMLEGARPNFLEVLFSPTDCVIYKHPAFDIIMKNRDKFIIRRCNQSFSQYARNQIKKAKGQDKLQNMDQQKAVERKTVLDFCFVQYKQGTINIKKWLELEHIDQTKCGLVALPHMPYMYGLYVGEEYNGIVSAESYDVNDVRLSNVSPDVMPYALMCFNKDAYTQQCRLWKRYQTWLEERNESRWVDVQEHGQKLDGKNMLHCQRLIDTALDIADGKGVVVRRPNASDLIDIKKGKVPLQELIDSADEKLVRINIAFDASGLPEDVEPGLSAKILKDIRHRFAMVNCESRDGVEI